MEVIGKIIEVLPVISGETESGEWKRGGFVVETMSDFPVTVQLDLGAERLDTFNQKFPNPLGKVVKVRFGITSRKVGDRWFTNARAWEVTGF